MENLWTGISISGRLMVSDFRNLHCEDSFSVHVDADCVTPGYKVAGIDSFSHGVTVTQVSPQWVQFEVGGKPVTVLSGQTVDGPDKPLSYAYGTIQITLEGKKSPALTIYDEMRDSKNGKGECMRLFEKLVDLAENHNDAWAAFLAAGSLSNRANDMSVDRLSHTTRMLINRLHAIVESTHDLDPVKERVRNLIMYYSSRYEFGALNMRYMAECFLAGENRSWGDSKNAAIAAAYSGRDDLVEQLMPFLKPGTDNIIKVMRLRYKQLHGMPYLSELKQLMGEGIWQAHFMYVLSFMPSDLALCDTQPDDMQIEESVAFLTDYYKANERYDSTTIDGLNLANFCRYCASGGKEGATPYDIGMMEKGSYRGLAFSKAIYGLVSADKAADPRELDKALTLLGTAAGDIFLWPKRVYLSQLTKYDLDPRTLHLLTLTLQ